MAYNNFTRFPYNVNKAKQTSGGHGILYFKRYGISMFDGETRFPAFITSYNEAYQSNWERQTVFGRSDPMQFYGGTQRNINVSFTLVAGSPEEGRQQLTSLDKLLTFLYPNYADGAYSSAPLIGVKYENLIRDGSDFLVGTMGNFNVTPNFEEGVFTPQNFGGGDLATEAALDALEVYPKIIELTFDFYPLHRETLGWQGSTFMSDDFHPIERTGQFVSRYIEELREAQQLAFDQIAKDPLAKLAELEEQMQKELAKKKKEELPGSPKDTIGKAESAAYLEGLQKQKAKLEKLVELSSDGFSQGSNSALNKCKNQLHEVEKKIAAAGTNVELVD